MAGTIHVYVEAGKNTRNAVGKMYKILLIDKGNSSIHSFREQLEDTGYSLVRVQELKSALHYLKKEDIDLVVVDKTFSSDVNNFRKFRQLAANVPKIVLTKTKSFKGMSAWLKDRKAIPLCEPIPYKEFKYWAERIYEDKVIIDRSKAIQTELQTKKKESMFFEDITRILTSTFEIDKILTLIMEKARVLTGAEAWSLLLVEGASDELIFGKIRRRKNRTMQKFKVKMGEGIAGWVAQKGIPVVVADVSKDSRFSKKIDRYPNLKVRSLICVPVKIKKRIIGVFELLNKQPEGSFAEEDMELFVKLASYATMAIERTLLYQKMEDLAVTDELTNLFNMRYLSRTLDMEIERSQRYGSSFSLVFMDIDYFKEVNDSFGHLIGSKILTEVAQLLLNNLRTVDTVARYGGDEFVIVLPQTPLKGGFRVAERLRRAIEEKVFLKHEGYSIKITASFGVASCPENARKKEELLKIADRAMYRGKFLTRNVVYAAK